MVLDITYRLTNGHEIHVSSSHSGEDDPCIVVPLSTIQSLSREELGACLYDLIPKALYLKSLAFADWLISNQGTSREIPTYVLKEYKDDLDALEAYRGINATIDHILLCIEYTHELRHRRTERKRRSQKTRRYITRHYNALFMRVGHRDGFHCTMCYISTDLQLDHIMPVSRGGGNDLNNLQILCKTCNQAKGASLLGKQESRP